MSDPRFGGMTWKGWLAASVLLAICVVAVLVIAAARGWSQGWPPATTYMSEESIKWWSERGREKPTDLCVEIREMQEILERMERSYCR